MASINNVTLKEFVDKYNIGLQLFPIPFRTDLGHTSDQWDKKARHFAFILSYDNKTYKGYYSQGGGIKRRPHIEDILNALVMDTLNISQDSFEDWCSEYDYSTDSINAHKIYTLCLEEYQGLKKLLGTKQLHELYDCELL